VDELSLSDWIVLTNPADLPFADGVHYLVTLNRSARARRRMKTEARHDPLLDETMVLLDDVVQVRRGSAAAASTKFARLLQLGDCAGRIEGPIEVRPSAWRNSRRIRSFKTGA
jgi:hypothetical protein